MMDVFDFIFNEPYSIYPRPVAFDPFVGFTPGKIKSTPRGNEVLRKKKYIIVQQATRRTPEAIVPTTMFHGSNIAPLLSLTKAIKKRTELQEQYPDKTFRIRQVVDGNLTCPRHGLYQWKSEE
jgi:hypothetical protein